MSGQDMHDAPANCENCGTPLQGKFCHACGQSVHSPVRSFAHAVEEVFESFWHLDGRVLHTLRDLWYPGRVALNYLGGQRARYIAPIRMFLILSLLTFFVGKLTVHFSNEDVGFDGREQAMRSAQTQQEVIHVRDELLKELEAKEKARGHRPGADMKLVASRARIEGEAAGRIADLKVQAEHPGKASKKEEKDTLFHPNGKPWDAHANPVNVRWLPGFANTWLNYKVKRAQANVDDMDGDEDRFLQGFLSALPTALFVLMPIFALLLKIFYLGSGRMYLEHLVVALYSHAWLLLMLMLMFLLSQLADFSAGAWVDWVQTFGFIALFIWIPIYLFQMQLRIYRQHWAVTTIKYLMIGSSYLVLVVFAALLALLIGIAS